ncbi:BREX-2 system phosphatase PglZ [Spirillospora sp. NPDC052242]
MSEPVAAAGTAGSRPAPVATVGIVAGEVRRARRRAPEGGTLFLRAAAEWRGPATLDVDGASVRVAPCTSLLAVLDAVSGKDADYLVVLSPFDRLELGDSLLAHAVGHDVISVNRWDLVRNAFGARRLDPRLTAPENAWLSDALLEAQPDGGWPKIKGALLDLDTALGEVAAARLGNGGATDAASLLVWSRDLAAVSRFTRLGMDEQRGIADWLERSMGPVARVLFRLVRAGNAADAIAFGVIARVLFQKKDERRQAVRDARVRAERLFGGGPLPQRDSLMAFAEACESLLLRWAEGDRPALRSVLARAQSLLDELQAGQLAGDSHVLEAGYDMRLRTLQKAIATALPAPSPVHVAEVDDGLAELTGHHLHDVRPETPAAEMAVRLVRWLAGEPEPGGALRDHVDRYVRDGAWVDRAVTGVRDAHDDAYTGLLAAVRARRDDFDRGFAQRLAAWSGGPGDAGDLVLVENLQAAVARPLAGDSAPLIVVLDGMTAAIATEITAEIVREGTGRWLEIGRHAQGREGALATIPSITTCSRTSLFSGELRTGGQAEERDGFDALWPTRRTELFHKAHIRDGLGDKLKAAVADRAIVVGVVLNAVDDSLDKGRADGRGDWHVGGIAGLRPLLDAAWHAGRPIVLTSDHGHVLDRGDASVTVKAEAARHRTGEPGDGEITMSGPRVLTGDGTVVVPWNERIRYNSRKDGYHGGVSLAEMVVPVVVLVPSGRLRPDGWEDYTPAMHEPVWWNRVAQIERVDDRTGKKAAPDVRAEEALFDLVEPADGIGARVVASGLFAAQREFVPSARVDDAGIIALLDALAEAGGKLPLQAAAQRAGQMPARMHGYVSTVMKLLNVDGYQVLAVTDRGATVALNVPLLREQFLGGGG